MMADIIQASTEALNKNSDIWYSPILHYCALFDFLAVQDGQV